MRTVTSVLLVCMLATTAGLAWGQDLHAANLAYLQERARGAPAADLERAAAFAAERGVDLRGLDAPAPRIAGSVSAGDLWHVCLGFFIPCETATPIAPTGVPCFAIPLDWSTNVYGPGHLGAELPAGIFNAWTTSHPGLTPVLVQHPAGTLVGSACVLLNDTYFVLVWGDAVFVPA